MSMQNLGDQVLKLFVYLLANANTQKLDDLFRVETVLVVPWRC